MAILSPSGSASSQKITAFLWFDGNALEAARFYTSIFPHARIIATTYYSENMHMPKGTVMTVAFDICGQRFTAMNGGPGQVFNESISFVINCDSQAEIDAYWSKLTTGGGKPVQCGWLIDRFGVRWQVVPSNIWELINGPNSPRVMQAVMKMVKLDKATLEKAGAKG